MKWLVPFVVLLAAPVAAAPLERPAFTPEIGQQITLSTALTDSTGANASLATRMAGRPAVVIFGYHDCPNLCGVTQLVVATGLSGTGLKFEEYVPLFITLAPEEGPADAAGAKARLSAAAGSEAASPWAFLSGPDVTALGEQFGIGAIERERIRQYVHPVAVYVLTPGGRIARVLPGLDIGANELRLALVEASAGTLGTVIDQIVLFCAGFDVSRGQYTSLVEAGLKIACLLTLLVAGGGLLVLELRKRTR